MNNIPETDQWLLTGECNKCRRQPYCKKICTAVKREFRKGVQQAVATALEKRLEERDNDQLKEDK